MADQLAFAVGDVHGYYKSLKKLIKQLPEDGPIIFVGDLINRGPHSLECVRLLMRSEKRMKLILGNHDIHCLAVAAGARPYGKKDTFKTILEAKDRNAILDWLRHQSLACSFASSFFVHASVHPSWGREEALGLAGEIEAVFQDANWKKYIGILFGNSPSWSEDLKGFERLRAALNIFVRVRYLHPDGTPDFSCNDAPGTRPAGLIPWYEFPRARPFEERIVFGHWSSCGPMITDRHICLDSGCCWKKELTACRLPSVRIWQTDGGLA
jgi:bis(5'-nucleosyl)-tetraphosphatase (symmetrical)